MSVAALTEEERDRIAEKFPGRLPVFVSQHGRDLPTLGKSKFLVPRDMTVGQFLWIVRRKLTLPPEKAIFLFVANVLPMSSERMGDVYAKYRSGDGALRMVYTTESTFG